MNRDQMREPQDRQSDPYGDASTRRHEDRAMTYPAQDRGSMEPSGSTPAGGSGGDWQGFVVPYRYYGPGYAGVGYYAVYYQGGEGQRGEKAETSGFDQRNVREGQGQGAEGAWQVGRWQDRPRGYAGRGPKGYTRSDERIREEVSDRLTEHDAIDASGIEVSVKDGVATLSGTVDSRWTKRLAEDLAERAPGVRDVMNQITVADQRAPRETSPTRQMSEGATPGGSAATPSAGASRSKAGTSKAKPSSGTTSRPVGSGVGGASDGETGNGSTRTS